jgi:outer membrane protein OmpA-like peptidoglycan-associated protein
MHIPAAGQDIWINGVFIWLFISLPLLAWLGGVGGLGRRLADLFAYPWVGMGEDLGSFEGVQSLLPWLGLVAALALIGFVGWENWPGKAPAAEQQKTVRPTATAADPSARLQIDLVSPELAVIIATLRGALDLVQAAHWPNFVVIPVTQQSVAASPVVVVLGHPPAAATCQAYRNEIVFAQSDVRISDQGQQRIGQALGVAKARGAPIVVTGYADRILDAGYAGYAGGLVALARQREDAVAASLRRQYADVRPHPVDLADRPASAAEPHRLRVGLVVPCP